MAPFHIREILHSLGNFKKNWACGEFMVLSPLRLSFFANGKFYSNVLSGTMFYLLSSHRLNTTGRYLQFINLKELCIHLAFSHSQLKEERTCSSFMSIT